MPQGQGFYLLYTDIGAPFDDPSGMGMIPLSAKNKEEAIQEAEEWIRSDKSVQRGQDGKLWHTVQVSVIEVIKTY